jgi:hypothetical protein
MKAGTTSTAVAPSDSPRSLLRLLSLWLLHLEKIGDDFHEGKRMEAHITVSFALARLLFVAHERPRQARVPLRLPAFPLSTGPLGLVANPNHLEVMPHRHTGHGNPR